MTSDPKEYFEDKWHPWSIDELRYPEPEKSRPFHYQIQEDRRIPFTPKVRQPTNSSPRRTKKSRPNAKKRKVARKAKKNNRK